MADALAAREQGVGELLDVHARVAVHVLEPLGGVAGGVLDLQHLDTAARLVAMQHSAQVGIAVAAELVGQIDRVFQRQFGAAADGEVRRVRGVAHEHDGDAPVGVRRRTSPLRRGQRPAQRRSVEVRNLLPVHPGVADHARELDPAGRASQVLGVADQVMAVQVLGEQALAESDALGLAHGVDAVGFPHGFGRFDDEGGGVGVELVGVGLKPAVFGLLEGKGEGVKGFLGAEPDEAAEARVDIGLVAAGVTRADAAVEAVAGDDQVGLVLLCQRLVVGDIGFKHQIHAQRQAAFLQDVEQPFAADAAKTVTAGTHALAFEEDLDVVPVVEGVADQLRRFGIGALQVLQGLVGKHDAPAKGIKRTVALDHRDRHRRIAPFHQQREVQTGGATANAQDALQRSGRRVHV